MVTYTIAHLGLNAQNAGEAQQMAQAFCALLGGTPRETPGAFFSQELVEVMKENGRGRLGHIGLRVADVEEAMADLQARGYSFLEDTLRKNEAGRVRFVYLAQEVCGFAVHLTL